MTSFHPIGHRLIAAGAALTISTLFLATAIVPATNDIMLAGGVAWTN